MPAAARCPFATAVTRSMDILAERGHATALRSASRRFCAGHTWDAVPRSVGLQRSPGGKHIAVCHRRVGRHRSVARSILHGRSSSTCDRRRRIGRPGVRWTPGPDDRCRFADWRIAAVLFLRRDPSRCRSPQRRRAACTCDGILDCLAADGPDAIHRRLGNSRHQLCRRQVGGGDWHGIAERLWHDGTHPYWVA